jgi:hypothetical protein
MGEMHPPTSADYANAAARDAQGAANANATRISELEEKVKNQGHRLTHIENYLRSTTGGEV